MEKIDYSRLRQDLLSKVGPSGDMVVIISVDTAPDARLVKYAEEYGLDINDYISGVNDMDDIQ